MCNQHLFLCRTDHNKNLSAQRQLLSNMRNEHGGGEQASQEGPESQLKQIKMEREVNLISFSYN